VTANRAPATVPSRARVPAEPRCGGRAAAKAAGIRCVARPDDVTAGLPFDDAGRRIGSLAVVTLDQLPHPARPTAT
jgi:hypothetical protein